GKKPNDPPFPLFARFPSRIERAGYQIYNYLDNSLYPVRPLYFGAAVAATAAFFNRSEDGSRLMQMVPTWGDGALAQYAKVGAVSLTVTYIPVCLTRFALRQFYFKYKRWLFEKKPSVLTQVWGVIGSLLSLVSPRLKSCESLLPSLPVPVLEETVKGYLASIRNVCSDEEFAAVEKMAEEFLKGEGRTLQRYTKLYSMFTENYVTGFWEKYAYLYSRSPLLINSSVVHLDNFVNIPATQAVRAAHIAYIEFLSHLAIDRQTYKPPGSGLLCARHYDRLYAIARVPGAEVDHHENYGISRHVVVLYNGGIYKVQVVDENDRIYSIDQLTDIFTELLVRADTEVSGAEGRVPALTHDTRNGWHANRSRFFESTPGNSKALKLIESAAFAITLSDEENWDYDPENPALLSRFMKDTLTGQGANRWVDKSLNYVIGTNGRYGGTGEHSIVDGSEFDHIMEYFVWMENDILTYPSLDDQRAREKAFDVVEAGKRVKFAERLEIDVSQEMASEIDRCYSAHQEAANDVDLEALVFRRWGKGRIKKCGCSPDAFIQMAIQLANYRDQGRFVLTYEATSARFFANSRTETLRSVTDASCAFVRAMEDGGETDKTHCITLLRSACELHSTRNRDCMVGRGVDRHLFVLFVMAKARGITSPLLDHYIKQEWLLSTSHLPNVTNTMKEDGDDANKSWLGASFGAVAKTGYGVCYRLAGNHSIVVYISSYHSAKNTNSARFRGRLERALGEMSALFD
ncbi:hypothetical protein PMAYCL1PPCAC_20266, partial [Pristionchus mayeri]